MKDRASDGSSSSNGGDAETAALKGQGDVKLDIEAGLPGDARFWRRHSGWLGRQSPFFQRALFNLSLILIWCAPHCCFACMDVQGALGPRQLRHASALPGSIGSALHTCTCSLAILLSARAGTSSARC